MNCSRDDDDDETNWFGQEEDSCNGLEKIFVVVHGGTGCVQQPSAWGFCHYYCVAVTVVVVHREM